MALSRRSKRKIAGWLAGVLATGVVALGVADDDDDDRDDGPGVVHEQDEDDD